MGHAFAIARPRSGTVRVVTSTGVDILRLPSQVGFQELTTTVVVLVVLTSFQFSQTVILRVERGELVMASESKSGADAQPQPKRHNDGAADLERVTDYVEEIEGSSEGVEDVRTLLYIFYFLLFLP